MLIRGEVSSTGQGLFSLHDSASSLLWSKSTRSGLRCATTSTCGQICLEAMDRRIMGICDAGGLETVGAFGGGSMAFLPGEHAGKGGEVFQPLGGYAVIAEQAQ